jgi:glycosyltransferase involved in cell wall biosynthesis
MYDALLEGPQLEGPQRTTLGAVTDPQKRGRHKGRAHAEIVPHLRHMAIVGTYPPLQCGIATFTRDVRAAMMKARPELVCDVIAMVRPEETNDNAQHLICRDVRSDYARVAEQVNASGVELVSIQHEFGIFGGDAGDLLLDFTSRLAMPFVVTLHTVIERPSPDQLRVVCELARSAAQVVVMARKGAELLRSIYNVHPDKISVVPHGAPDRPLQDTQRFKPAHGWDGRRVALTFGLLSPGKGIETVIEAMPEIAKACPKALYVVLGATHPELVRREGEAYRDRLQARARDLGVERNVCFVDKYCEIEELLDYLCAADVYVTPYLNEAQITSGTLAYAIAMGRPVVSTPYWHAVEVVTPEMGRLVQFNDTDGFAGAIAELLSDPDLCNLCSQFAYQQGRRTIWSEFANHHIELFEVAMEESRALNVTIHPGTVLRPDLGAVMRLSDECGIIQFSQFSVPDWKSGYCVDDVARALLLLVRMRAVEPPTEWVERQQYRYASFLRAAWNPATGRFHNFMSFDRVWLDKSGSDDSNGRAFWAIAECAAFAGDPGIRTWARDFLAEIHPPLARLESPRTRAYMMLGAGAWLQAARGSPGAMQIMIDGKDALLSLLAAVSKPGWQWFEERLAYDNARLSQSLLTAAKHLDDQPAREAGLSTLEWLATVQRAPGGEFRAVGNVFNLLPYQTPAAFDQQPIEACAMIEASLLAAEMTGEARWIREASLAHNWFHGGNELNAKLACPGGGCMDGLHPEGPNLNQGAESVLSLQLANVAMAKTKAPMVRSASAKRTGG